ncbi:hypothetical protein RhiJN_24779 [Ceratobasidium sp. AG-Ba]|nr:hypothetical protein RhiJN_24779 [Ceratobasidium sp. AG-Ba]
MSKRKVGGYDLSDDEDDASTPPAKKPWVPPHLSTPAFKMPSSLRNRSTTPTPAQKTAPRYQSPLSRTVVSASSGHPEQVHHTISASARKTPSSTVYARTSSPDLPDPGANQVDLENDFQGKGKQRAESQAESSSSVLPKPRRHPYEREIHELQCTVADSNATIEEQGKELAMMQESLIKLQGSFDRLTLEFERYKETQATRWAEAAANIPAPAIYSGPPDVIEAAASNTQDRPKLTVEKAAMPGLAFDPRIDLTATAPVSDIKTLGDLVASFRQKPKGERYTFPAEPLIQTHVRRSAFEVLEGVQRANNIKAPFYDAHGQHILLPPELADETGHIKPYPLFVSKELKNQIIYVERFLQRFRATVPKNESEFSVVGRTIREDLLISIFINGPWNTCCQQWSVMLKDESKLAARQRQSRLLKQKMAKTGARRLLRSEIPGLAGKQYDAMFHEAMMSEEESEGEGADKRLQIKRPIWRSKQVNAMWDAMSECTRRQREKSSRSFQSLPRVIDMIQDDNIPEVRREGKLLSIPLFAFLGRWRSANRALITEKDHRLDVTLTKFPDISDFLESYQRADELLSLPTIQQPIPEQPRSDTHNRDANQDIDTEDHVESTCNAGDEVWLGEMQDEVGIEGEGRGDEAMVLGEENEAHHNTNQVGRSDSLVAIVAGAESIAIDPNLDNSAPGIAPSRPRPKQRPPPRDQTPPPTSSIQINIPSFNNIAPPLPLPYSNHNRRLSRTESTHVSNTALKPTAIHSNQSEPPGPSNHIQMPPGGPSSPPPEVEPTSSAQGHDRNQEFGEQVDRETEIVGVSTRTRQGRQGNTGSAGRKKKDAKPVNEGAKRPRGRP